MKSTASLIYAFEIYKRDLLKIFTSTVLLLFLSILVIGSGLAIGIVVFFILSSIGLMETAGIYILALFGFFIILGIIFFVSSFIGAYFYSLEKIRTTGRRLSLFEFMDYAYETAVIFFGIKIVKEIIAVLIILPVFALFLITNQIQLENLDLSIIHSSLFIYASIISTFLEVIFGFAFASVAINKTNSAHAIKTAFNIVRKYPFDYIILSVLLIIISHLCLLIPYVGLFLLAFFFAPIFVLTFLRIYKH